MVGRIYSGPRRWGLTRDDEGHRVYKVTHLVRTTSTLDGPSIVMATPGLPVIGSVWNFDNDFDPWAFCRPNMVVTPRVQDQKNLEWKVDQVFSTLPLFRCQDETIEDPLLEPDRVSGSFVNYLREASRDKDDARILTSAFEPIHGPQVEFDSHRATVRIEQNRATLGLSTFTNLMNTLNDATLWGLGARKVKLSNVSWERKLFGVCDFYYTRSLEFDIDFDTFDRDDILDEGTMVLSREWNPATGVWDDQDVGGGAPSNTNPTHFKKAKDPGGNPINVVLDGAGRATTTEAGAGAISVQFYQESNLLVLGIPTSF